MSNRTGPCGMLRHSFKMHVCIFIAHNPKWRIHVLYLITSTILKSNNSGNYVIKSVKYRHSGKEDIQYADESQFAGFAQMKTCF